LDTQFELSGVGFSDAGGARLLLAPFVNFERVIVLAHFLDDLAVLFRVSARAISLERLSAAR
jgi:hypothetical protein